MLKYSLDKNIIFSLSRRVIGKLLFYLYEYSVCEYNYLQLPVFWNILIQRRVIPKDKSQKSYSINHIKQIMHWMNHLPRKILNDQKPSETILLNFSHIQMI